MQFSDTSLILWVGAIMNNQHEHKQHTQVKTQLPSNTNEFVRGHTTVLGPWSIYYHGIHWCAYLINERHRVVSVCLFRLDNRNFSVGGRGNNKYGFLCRIIPSSRFGIAFLNSNAWLSNMFLIESGSMVRFISGMDKTWRTASGDLNCCTVLKTDMPKICKIF